MYINIKKSPYVAMVFIAGNNGTVVYSLQSTSNPSGTFIINGTTGQLNTTGPLNREQVPFYNLTVIVSASHYILHHITS